ncbi:MAG: sodium-dependent bicarbonate transport family permease [Chloroflexota bacterium]
MDILEVLRLNVFSPMVLAFVLGIIAVLVKSDLRIPDQIYTIISVYLLFAIGLKGGFDLAKSNLADFWGPAFVSILIGAGIPVWSYLILRRSGGFAQADAAALGIHYGAVSAVTLSAAVTFLGEAQVAFEGFMPTMYAIIEIPAIAGGLLIATSRLNKDTGQTTGEVLRSALSGKSFLLLGGGVIIGFISGDVGERQVAPFFIDLFPGILTLFLLEMGTIVGERLRDLRKVGLFLVGFGVIMPVLHGLLGTGLGTLAGLSVGGSMILGTLAASASYITAPAAVRANIPQANPSYYLTAALVITFPFNLVVGLPLYFEFAQFFAGGL